MNPIRVVLVDDQELIRAGLSAILHSESTIRVVAEAANGRMGAQAAKDYQADIALMDIQMPVSDGLEGLSLVLQNSPSTKVLMLSMFDLDEYVYAALHAGASGFLLKTTPAAELIRCIIACHRGESLFAPEITKRLIQVFVAHPPIPAGLPPVLRTLTNRELEVFSVLSLGLSNAEIGARLYLGETTVKTHVTKILGKLGLRDRIQAVVLAYESGYRVPGEDS